MKEVGGGRLGFLGLRLVIELSMNRHFVLDFWLPFKGIAVNIS